MHKGITNFLSAVIITKNEEKNIAACLQSLQGIADEVIVVDSFSTDKTEEVCKSFGATFFSKEWEGYASTKNWANAQANSHCIISLDADEVLSEELKKSILAVKNSVDENNNFFYSFHRLTNYCGKWIKHGGWYPDTKTRLFDRRKARWVGDFVHETLQIDDNIQPKLLKGDCLHYSFHSISQHIDNINHYSTLAAQEQFAKGKKSSLGKLIFSPWISFMKMYLFKAGFLDGKYGFIIAVISAMARFIRYAKLYQMWNSDKN
ncbi:MAG: glycosyltransferase family 2 protein [Sphingobacteriales bacterium]|nr:MAG: glycosyltransferase family 2 protein [Sphingobacteriales bacterium]